MARGTFRRQKPAWLGIRKPVPGGRWPAKTGTIPTPPNRRPFRKGPQPPKNPDLPPQEKNSK